MDILLHFLRKSDPSIFHQEIPENTSNKTTKHNKKAFQ